MPIVFARANNKIQVERAMGASLPAFVDIPGMAISTTSLAEWSLMFSGMFLVPKPGAVELQFAVDGVAMANSQRVMDVSAGGLMNDRCLTLEWAQNIANEVEVTVQWRAVKGKITLGDRRFTIFH